MSQRKRADSDAWTGMEAESLKPSVEIEQDMERTRARIDQTLTAIERRFTPGELVNRVIDYVSGGPKEYAANLGRSARIHPLPVALAAIGIGWLMAAGDRVPSAEYELEEGPSLREKYGRARERAGHAAGRARETFGRISRAVGSKRRAAGEQAGAARERLADVREIAEHRSSRVRRRIGDTYEKHPLLSLMAAGLALGAVLGAVLPTSETEERMLAGKREKFIERLKEQSREQLEKGPDIVTAAGEAAREKPGQSRPAA